MKELPYFKFNCSEWISGSITLESLQIQGAFINICAYYWFKSGSLTLSEIKRRVNLKQAIINRLVEIDVIKVDGDSIKISFLDEQFEERGHRAEINKINGSKGGAPKGNKNAIKINQRVVLKQPKTTNIEEEKEKKENKNIQIFGNVDDSDFIIIQDDYINSSIYKIHGVNGLKDFMEANISILNYPEHANKFMSRKRGDRFNNIQHLRNAYNLFVEKQYK